MTLTFEFDRATSVTLREPGCYDVRLDEGWVVGGGVNGGYQLAVVGSAVRAFLADAGHPDPVAVSAHYVTPAPPGPAEVQLRTVRSGGRFSTVEASLVQVVDGQPTVRITVLATYADQARLEAAAAPPVLSLEPPPIPPVEQCATSDLAPAEVRAMAPFLERFDLRLDPATAGWALGEPSRAGVIQGWFRFHDDRPVDGLALLAVVDALPPVTMDLGQFGWAPTVQLTAHVRAVAEPGWLHVRHATRTMAHGLFEEDCEVWDATGRLVAQSRQLALQPR